MKKEMTEETIEIPNKLALKIKQAVAGTPGLDFNLLVNQAFEQWFNKSPDMKKYSLAELRERFIEDTTSGHGPKA